MDELRYWIACALLVGLPPGLLFWLCIHPFAGFWRKRGPGWTYGLVGAGLSLLGGGLFAVRSALLATEYGTNAVCLGLAGGVSGRGWRARSPAPETPDPAYSGRAA